MVSLSCRRLPCRLILSLIEIMNMMTKIMVKYPSIAYYSCLETIDDFEKSIEYGYRESLYVLVVVVPR
jgi:hypothetical protein